MRIGIDAKWYFNGHPSGKVVVENIVNHLLISDSQNDYYIFLDKKDKNLDFPHKQPNVHLVYVPNLFNAITNIFVMPWYTLKYQIDVCLYQNYAATFGAKKIINYVHDALFMDYKAYFSLAERLYFYPMKYLSKLADHVITISNSEKERMVKHKFSKREKISVVYHGIGLAEDLSHEHTLNLYKKYNLPKNYILYLGRLNIRKNIQNLLKAMPLVNEEVSLVVVGKQDHKSVNYDLIIKGLNLQDRVVKVGYVDAEDIGSFYSNATVFCFPSYAEGFGLPPLEAMFYGTPVVVSNRTSLPEICEDAALYIDPDNPQDIANKINNILDDDEIAQELRNKGHQRASEFNWKKTSKEILEILERFKPN